MRPQTPEKHPLGNPASANRLSRMAEQAIVGAESMAYRRRVGRMKIDGRRAHPAAEFSRERASHWAPRPAPGACQRDEVLYGGIAIGLTGSDL